ncbi:hypothetical protein BKA63DRAFT_498216 [Paraphoma chrysanthemicola]|nr:hypothetical protein BKA63DRAFT_498216 [Paraphoma chrysanthemicola]
MSPSSKRTYGDADLEIALPDAKRRATSPSPGPTHPHAILEHLVRVVLPESCRQEAVNKYYEEELRDSTATIDKCKDKLKGWVLEYWDAGKLRELNAYDFTLTAMSCPSSPTTRFLLLGCRRDSMTDLGDRLDHKSQLAFPDYGGIYVIVVVIDGELWFYVSQSSNVSKRISSHHSSQNYSKIFLYFLWSKAEAAHVLLPVEDDSLETGPFLNILEQWLRLVFCALRPSDLKINLAIEALCTTSQVDLCSGIGVCEPLAQNFDFANFPMHL